MKPLIVASLIILASCAQNGFYNECEELASIIIHSNKLLEIKNSHNNYDKNGDVVSVTFIFNKNNSAAYIKRNKGKIKKIMSSLKHHINVGDKYRDDSIYMLVLSDNIFSFITEETSEYSCEYQHLIRNNEIPPPSKWIVNNVFMPLFTNKDTQQELTKMNYEQQVEMIKRYLLESFGNCMSVKGVVEKRKTGSARKTRKTGSE